MGLEEGEFLSDRNEERRGITSQRSVGTICIKIAFILRTIMTTNTGAFCSVLFGEFRACSYGPGKGAQSQNTRVLTWEGKGTAHLSGFCKDGTR